MIDNSAIRVALSILNAFTIIAAAISAYLTSIEIGFMPILALAIKGFLLGSAISAVVYMTSKGEEEESNVDKKEADAGTAHVWDFSFFLGFCLLSLYASILMIAGAVLLTTLLFFIVGILTIFSGASSRIVERADVFVIIAASLALIIYLMIVIGPWLVAFGFASWAFGSGNLWISLGSFGVYMIIIGIIIYHICISCADRLSKQILEKQG